MSDPVAVIVARLEIWVKTVLTEIKKINSDQHDAKSEEAVHYKELLEKGHKHDIIINEILTNRKTCDKNFVEILSELNTMHGRIPNEHDIEALKDHNKKVDVIWDKIKFFSGWAAGVAFLIGASGAIIALIKRMSE